jgi:NosR/NirI family nitrous oxide reductase transcriptional regulator
LLVLSMSAPAAAVDRTTIDEPFSERALSNTFPGADSFSEPSGEYRTVEAYEEVDGERELVGYVYLTSNVVDVEGYGNEPIEYLVALDTNGTIRGVELVEQHEPFFDRISAIQRLRQFGYQMVGMSVTEEVTLREAESDEYHVDALTGASVTTRASIETVTRSARIVAREKGIVSGSGEENTSESATNESSERRRMTLADLGRGTDLAHWTAAAPDAPAGSNASLDLYAAPIESGPVRRSMFGNGNASPPQRQRDGSLGRPRRPRVLDPSGTTPTPPVDRLVRALGRRDTSRGRRLERRAGGSQPRYVPAVRPRSDRRRRANPPDLRPRWSGGS